MLLWCLPLCVHSRKTADCSQTNGMENILKLNITAFMVHVHVCVIPIMSFEEERTVILLQEPETRRNKSVNKPGAVPHSFPPPPWVRT